MRSASDAVAPPGFVDDVELILSAGASEAPPLEGGVPGAGGRAGLVAAWGARRLATRRARRARRWRESGRVDSV